MIVRLLWWGTLAALALVATFAQIDRAARFDPRLADAVPSAFAGFAAEQTTRRAIAAQDGEAAMAEARRLLAKRPLPAEHLALFAVASAMAGDEQRSLAALELGVQRGWREPMAQQAAAAAAIGQGAHDLAAMRIAALYSVGGQGEIASTFAAELLTTHEGREAFAKRFAAEGHWQGQALGVLSELADPEDFAATAIIIAREGGNFDCERLSRIADRYRWDGELRAAETLNQQCPG